MVAELLIARHCVTKKSEVVPSLSFFVLHEFVSKIILNGLMSCICDSFPLISNQFLCIKVIHLSIAILMALTIFKAVKVSHLSTSIDMLSFVNWLLDLFKQICVL